MRFFCLDLFFVCLLKVKILARSLHIFSMDKVIDLYREYEIVFSFLFVRKSMSLYCKFIYDYIYWSKYIGLNIFDSIIADMNRIGQDKNVL